MSSPDSQSPPPGRSGDLGRLLPAFKLSLVTALFWLLRLKVVNLSIRIPLKPLASRLPAYFLNRFPVTGDVQVSFSASHSIVLRTDGRDTIASRLYWNGLQGHEPETVTIYAELLSNANTVFDVGASTGLFSLIAGRVNPTIEVHSFEPIPETFDWLVRNIAVNHLENVNPVKACITNYDGKIAIYPNESPALPFQASIREGYQARETPRTIIAQALSLDSYVATIGAKTVDLLKIDAEASDHIVLEGARTVLDRYKPLIICEVLYTDTDGPLQDFLEHTNYRYFQIVDGGLLPKTRIVGDSNYIYRNYLFVHESRLDAVVDRIISV